MVDDVVYIFGGRGVDGKDLGDLGAFKLSSKLGHRTARELSLTPVQISAGTCSRTWGPLLARGLVTPWLQRARGCSCSEGSVHWFPDHAIKRTRMSFMF